MKLLAWMLASAAAVQLGKGLIQDRPLTWDWHGAVPLEAQATPTPEQVRLFELMRAGEYSQAALAAKGHFEKNPDDTIDAWILAECARKRRTQNELLAFARSLPTSSNSPAAHLLRIRALGLVYKQVKGNAPGASDERIRLGKEIEAAARAAGKAAEGRFDLTTVILGCGEGDILNIRELTRRLIAKYPDRPEGRMLLVRALLRGTMGTTVAISRGGVTTQVPLAEQRLGMRKPEPQMTLAFKELEDIEKRFGNLPLIGYYRAAAYAMEAQFADSAKSIVPPYLRNTDWRTLERKAVAHAEAFLARSEGYPRLATAARKYLQRRSFWAFFPQTDE